MSAPQSWHQQARFGMFVHWGPYAVAGRGEWVRAAERLTRRQYQRYVDAFLPTDWNADELADLAARAGVRYAVLTAKHHDGFCLFDSALTDYTTMHNGLGRDLVREFLTAFRKRGIRVGLYYSLLDWAHPDYPAHLDEHHPQRGEPDVPGARFDRYLDHLHGQVRELCTDYGDLDLLWFDFSYGDLTGEAWRGGELVRMIRDLQPGIVINNRLEASGSGYGSRVTGTPSPWAGDYVSPEQVVPLSPIRDVDGAAVPWETCLTMNNHWGHVPTDTDVKSSAVVVRTLIDCVSKGGNLLLNVGPDARGAVPQPQREVWLQVGEWMASNGASIVGAGAADLPRPEFGRYTRSGSTIYAHVWEQPIGPLPLPGIDPDEVVSVTRLADGSEVPIAKAWVTEMESQTAFVGLSEVAHHSTPLPDARATVLEIALTRPSYDDSEG